MTEVKAFENGVDIPILVSVHEHIVGAYLAVDEAFLVQ